MASSYEDATYREIVYLAKVLGWGFEELWNLPVAMRKRFIKLHNTMEEEAKDEQEAQQQKKMNQNSETSPMSTPDVFHNG